jgi:hypothetical protein
VGIQLCGNRALLGGVPMKSLHRFSLILIAIPLVAVLWSSRWMILYVEPQRAQIAYYDENWVHEIGFARLTLSLIGLLVLFIPYRRGERWAFAALAVLMICYILPAGFFLSSTNLGHWLIFRKIAGPPYSTSVGQLNFERYFFATLAFAGLAIAMPQFIRDKRMLELGKSER